MIQPIVIRLNAFKGLNTASARGQSGNPNVLNNVWLEHLGGYSPMRIASTLLSGTQAVVYALSGEMVYWLGAGNTWNTWAAGVSTLVGTAWFAASRSVPLSPNLAQISGVGNTQIGYLTPEGIFSALAPSEVIYWNGVLPKPVGPHYFFRSSATGGVDTPALTTPTRIILWQTRTITVFKGSNGQLISKKIAVRPGRTDITYDFTLLANRPPTSAEWNSSHGFFNVVFDNLSSSPTPVALYARVTPQGALGYIINNVQSYTGATVGTDLLNTIVLGSASTTPPTPAALYAMLPQIDTATYHNGRIYCTALNVYTSKLEVPLAAFDANATVVTSPTTLWYSEVFYSSSKNDLRALPVFYEDQFFNIPFKTSDRIVGLASVGQYLYIFGNRELLVLIGNSDQDFQLQHLGDSVGAIQGDSIRQLGTTVYWLSDSGVMMVRGGQMAELSAEVRDVVQSLNKATLSSTVDYERELYYLCDGTKLLCLDTREQGGWSTRDVTVPGWQLKFVGGNPCAYSSSTGSLYSLSGRRVDGTLENLMTMSLNFDGLENGDFWNRDHYAGIGVGLDCDGPTVVGHACTTSSNAALGTETQNAVSGMNAIQFRLVAKAEFLNLRLSVAPSSAVNRCILRPPLTVRINDSTEARV